MHLFSKFAWLVGLILFCQLNAAGQTQVIVCNGKASHSYHKQLCTGLKQCKATTSTISLKAAIEAKHDPCDFCYGPEKKVTGKSINAPNKLSSAPSLSVSTSQCQAITKKGSQCSRKGDNNGYCWQHSK